jgi:hypothetical protein
MLGFVLRPLRSNAIGRPLGMQLPNEYGGI